MSEFSDSHRDQRLAQMHSFAEAEFEKWYAQNPKLAEEAGRRALELVEFAAPAFEIDREHPVLSTFEAACKKWVYLFTAEDDFTDTIGRGDIMMATLEESKRTDGELIEAVSNFNRAANYVGRVYLDLVADEFGPMWDMMPASNQFWAAYNRKLEKADEDFERREY